LYFLMPVNMVFWAFSLTGMPRHFLKTPPDKIVAQSMPVGWGMLAHRTVAAGPGLSGNLINNQAH
jgi:hypothetical protein